MQFISLLADSAQIHSQQVHAVFQSKIKKLTAALGYLDRVGIKATITIEGREKARPNKTGNTLETFIEVCCEDKGFKAVLEKMVDRFNDKRELPAQHTLFTRTG